MINSKLLKLLLKVGPSEEEEEFRKPPHSRWDKTSIITVTMSMAMMMMILSPMHILVLLSEGDISHVHHNALPLYLFA